MIFLFYFQIFFPVSSTSQVVSKFSKFSICKWNKLTGDEYDCSKKWGQSMFSEISIAPNKEIITTFPKEVDGIKIIKYPWSSYKVKMNDHRTLYIYTLLDKDINFEGGFLVTLIIRLDYSIRMVKISNNNEGTIINTTLFTE